MAWRFYRQAWEAEKALKAAVPTAWIKAGGKAFAVVRFPREAEPGEWWAERAWVADALWELAEKYDVGVWYEYVRAGKWVDQYDVFCGVVVDGVRLYQPHCRSVDDCVRQIIEDYKREVEKMNEPPEPEVAGS
jgi:hypothetical protein